MYAKAFARFFPPDFDDAATRIVGGKKEVYIFKMVAIEVFKTVVHGFGGDERVDLF